MRKYRLFTSLVVFLAFSWIFLSGGMLGPAEVEAKEPLKAAFIYVGPVGDLGWSWEHDTGRKMLETEFGDKVKTTYIESVPEGPDAARVIRQYAQQGYKVIFATSFGYMDPMLEVARDFPGVYFEHCSGFKTAANMRTYFGRMYQPRYLSGIVAGKATKTNIIGYAAAFPIPECGPIPGSIRSKNGKRRWPCWTPVRTSLRSIRTRPSRRKPQQKGI
jgi:basic membrane lipoprotein Med (substrate-binding protein (PBP1-ABC) superfamily)